MAFCIDRDWLSTFAVPSIGKNLLFKRLDKEKTETNEIANFGEYETSDWPLYTEPDPLRTILYTLINEGKYRETDDYAINVYLPERVKVGIEHISKYEKVYSNRLHGALLSILLGKETYIIDNSYGKNSQYYSTWLKNTKNIHLVNVSKTGDIHRTIRFMFHAIRGLLPF